MPLSLNLSRAETSGLTSYVHGFGKALIPHQHFLFQRGPVPEEILASSLTQDSVEVSLERVFDEQWEGHCSCPDGIDCMHCLAAAAYLLGLPANEAAQVAAKPLTTPVATPRNIAPRDDLAGLACAALGRPLTEGERSYLDGVERIHKRSAYTLRLADDDLIHLANDPADPDTPFRPTRSASVPTSYIFPSHPESRLEFYHGLVRLLRLHGLQPPRFLTEMLRRNPPPEAWVSHWRNHEATLWFQAMDAALNPARHGLKPAPSQGAPRRVLGMRMVLTPGEPTFEVRYQESEPWRVAKKTEISRTTKDVAQLKMDAEDTSAALVHQVARWLAEPIRRSLDYEISHYNDESSFVASLLSSPPLRSSIVLASREPVADRIHKAGWQAVPSDFGPDGNPTHYKIEPCWADGLALPSCIAIAQGDPSWIITPQAVIELPRLPQHIPHSDYIPAHILEMESGLRFLHALGAAIPKNLEDRIQRVRLKPSIQLNVVQDGKSQRLVATAVALDAEGRPVEKLDASGWSEAKKPGRRPKAPAAGQPVVLHQRDGLGLVDAAMEGLQAKWDPVTGGFSTRVTKQFPDRFLSWVENLPKDVDLQVPPELAHFTEPPIAAHFQLRVSEAQVDWFDLTATLTAEGHDLTPEELQLLLDAEGAFVNLPGKGWRRARVTLSPEDRQHLAELGLEPSAVSSEPTRLHALQLNNPAAHRLLPEQQAAHVQRRADEVQARVAPPVPEAIQASLRPYQLEGFHFLAYLSQNRFGGVLADDMGLGKTLQTLAWIEWLRSRDPAEAVPDGSPGAAARHILIVCPKSVLPNWLAEARRFLPTLRITAWSGSDPASVGPDLASHDALVVNYAQLRLLEADLSARSWLAVVLDEAQSIKNPDSQTAQAARKLATLHRLALTGTPIENRLLDLWSILAFAMPGALGSRAQFQRAFAKDDPLARRRLAARLRPFLIRRTKGQVAQDLPDRIEEDILCQLEGVQKSLYTAEYKKARALLLGLKTKSDLDKFRFHFLTSLLRLRQICCHAALVDPKHREQPSAKLEALLELVEPLLSQGLKVLVFSQFTGMLDLLRASLDGRGTTTFLLTGETEDRGPLVDAFNQHEGAAVFLISLKAGGFGLNLTSASYVVLFDPWWNPAVENQAIDRTHRIGQKNTVFAYRLVVQGSIEEKIRELQRSKSALAQDILGEERFAQALSIDDLRFLFSTPEAPL